MCDNARRQNIHIKALNGYMDHIHALIFLKSDQTIAQVARLMKGESSHWININRLTKTKFYWQNEYYADSVSPGAVNNLRKYIINQEEHHKMISSDDEIKNIFKVD